MQSPTPYSSPGMPGKLGDKSGLVAHLTFTVQCHNKEIESKWRKFRDSWKTCRRCCYSPKFPGSKSRRYILYQGHLPCDLLLIGEAPGVSEDSLGIPFVGPSGRLLHEEILHTEPGFRITVGGSRLSYNIGITNTIACAPFLKTRYPRTETPDKNSITACFPRLEELFELAAPKALVLLGNTAALMQHAYPRIPTLQLPHPAWIIRQSPSLFSELAQQQSLKLKSFLETLSHVS